MKRIVTILFLLFANVVNAQTYTTNFTSWKSHTTGTVEFTADTWTDIEFDLKITAESLEGISYFDEGEATEDKSILVIKGFNDIFSVSGCLHFDWTGAAGTAVSTFSRILFSYDQGSTWVEARCLQTNMVESKGADAEGTQPYNGTIYVNGETWVKLQVRVSNDDMILQGNAVFDNPVAATITLSNLGYN